MTFWDHLDELRRRLLRAGVAILLAAIGGFLISARAQQYLMGPFVDKVSGSLALLSPTDGFMIQVKIALFVGALLASPLVCFELYGFVGPGLTAREKRWLWPVVLIGTTLFWGGVVFAWLVLPTALAFLGSFADFGIQNLWSLKTYINFVLFLLLSFGIIFQLPLIIGLLIATGLVPSTVFRRNRRYAIVIIFILAGFATPSTDMLTMLLMAGPLIVLYELSIWVGVAVERNRRSKRPPA